MKEKSGFTILGGSVGAVLLCLGLIIYFIINELLGEVPAPGIVMIFAWCPCLGLILLQILIYIYALYCRKANPAESNKMRNSTAIFGILISIYMIAVSLIFLYTSFVNYMYYLSVMTISIINLALLIWYRHKNDKMV